METGLDDSVCSFLVRRVTIVSPAQSGQPGTAAAIKLLSTPRAFDGPLSAGYIELIHYRRCGDDFMFLDLIMP